MHLRISNHDTNQITISQTPEGTYVNLKKPDRSIMLRYFSPFSGVSLCTVEQDQENLENYEFPEGIFLGCKFDKLHVEGNNSKVLLSGINTERFSVTIEGSNNSVIFTCESNVGSVEWSEKGSQNILDLSQQVNTSTHGNFSPTTNVITKCHKLPDCTMCYENSIDTLLTPCGHLGLCHECAERVFKQNERKVCPFCRHTVQSAQTLFVT